MFDNGAYAHSFDLPFGANHEDTVPRNDIHDAIGTELQAVLQCDS